MPVSWWACVRRATGRSTRWARRCGAGWSDRATAAISCDPYVSSLHCVLERQAGGALIVRDRKSRNGTQVDGNVVEGAELRVGSYLTLGRTTLVALAAPSSERASAMTLLRGHAS